MKVKISHSIPPKMFRKGHVQLDFEDVVSADAEQIYDKLLEMQRDYAWDKFTVALLVSGQLDTTYAVSLTADHFESGWHRRDFINGYRLAMRLKGVSHERLPPPFQFPNPRFYPH